MRVSSLVVLLLVVGGILYLVFMPPAWFTERKRSLMGYGAAETPTDAIDKFIKAVKKRDLETAATFCTGDYAAHLKRGAAAAAEIGPVIDGIDAYMRNKGLATDKAVLYLTWLDPFPTHIKMGAAPNQKDNVAVGFVVEENIYPGNEFVKFTEVRGVDPQMYRRVLMPSNLFHPKGFEMVKDEAGWKLKFPLPAEQVQTLDHYLNNYKSYHTGLTVFRRDVTNDRFPSKQDFETELITTLDKAK
jgi:hypothetical protein